MSLRLFGFSADPKRNIVFTLSPFLSSLSLFLAGDGAGGPESRAQLPEHIPAGREQQPGRHHGLQLMLEQPETASRREGILRGEQLPDNGHDK